MTDHLVLMTYPAYIIGQTVGDDVSEQIPLRLVDNIPMLPVFTEQIFAERFMDAENLDGIVFAVPNREVLVQFISRYRHWVEFVLLDPIPETGRGTKVSIDAFLIDLKP